MVRITVEFLFRSSISHENGIILAPGFDVWRNSIALYSKLFSVTCKQIWNDKKKMPYQFE